MMAEFIQFMFFSMIEVLALMALMMALFRFKISEYIWPALLVNLIMNLQSFALREELTLAVLVPIINILLLTAFNTLIVRVPLIWSFIMSFFGYIAYVLVQVIIVAASAGYLSVAAVQTDLVKGSILQSISAVIGLALSYLLYKFGIGLSFEFEKLRFKWERSMIYLLIGVMLIAFAILIYYREVYVDIIFLLMSLIFFLYYTLRKETDRHDTCPSQ